MFAVYVFILPPKAVCAKGIVQIFSTIRRLPPCYNQLNPRQAYDSGHAQIVRVFYCQNKAATCAAYWLHLHRIITVNIRGVVAPQVLL